MVDRSERKRKRAFRRGVERSPCVVEGGIEEVKKVRDGTEVVKKVRKLEGVKKLRMLAVGILAAELLGSARCIVWVPRMLWQG